MNNRKFDVSSPWANSPEEVLSATHTPPSGLSAADVEERLKTYGPNAFPEETKPGIFSELIDAFKDPLALTLTVAAILSAVIGLLNHDPDNLRSAALIEGIVVVMVLVGYVTDLQSGKALDALKKMQKTMCRVQRGNEIIEIEATQLVVGDIVLLKEGDRVPADCRVLYEVMAKTSESALTGESAPVSKSADQVAEGTELAARSDMLFSGTDVVGGDITAVVVCTGLNTELGKIYDQVKSAEETQTPLQKQLETLGDFLTKATFAVCGAIILIFLARNLQVFTTFFSEPSAATLEAVVQTLASALIVAVALAIAFIPEALGAVITIALAFGVREMVAEKAIIRRLRAAEGLGSVSVVCTDKTGTVTFGAMKATHLWTANTGEQPTEHVVSLMNVGLNRLLKVIQLCNNLAGPTEKALADLARLAGFEMNGNLHESQLEEIPFNSSRKMMSKMHLVEGQRRLFTKGAPERLIERCTHILSGNDREPMTEEWKMKIREAVTLFELRGMRVLAFADRDIDGDGKIDESTEWGLTFCGLVAMSDPARPEVRKTVAIMRAAGINPVIITGDSPRTALAIAQDVDILDQTAALGSIMTGSELDRYDANNIDAIPEVVRDRIIRTSVFARTSPTHKLLIVKVFQAAGKLVAMTGDGVNDAPSLKQANVGIAMVNGTDVTKEVADVILTGTYSAIAAAVRVGRTILHRTRLYSHALLSTNGAEVGIFVLAVVLGWAIPLTAIQLLTINLLGDAWLSIALATEKSEKDVMQRPPRRAEEPFINGYMLGSIIVQSIVVTSLLGIAYLLAVGYAQSYGFDAKQTTVLTQTTIFVTFMVQKILRSSFTARSLSFNIWQIGFFSNKWCLLAALASGTLAVAAMYLPIFGMMPLPEQLLPYVLLLGVVPSLVEEAIKLVRRGIVSQTQAVVPAK